MERDHRLVSVRDWAAARRQTLQDLLYHCLAGDPHLAIAHSRDHVP
jgi:hypothetical protein